MELLRTKCLPCERGGAKLEPARIMELLPQVAGWNVKDDKLGKTFEFKDFVTAMQFLNRVAELAEKEGHHPDFCLHHYNRVDFTIFTHEVGGLSDNDFIIAAKIDQLS
ncbi:MAG TPA: 4a-hydroxytetrahydrobiopterin dehydratase [Polyangiaceae bacterium]|nr:4a-hydroxytetrahydrobiopterin dehydratase [Polyangiaceae bacterium]